MGTSKIEWTDIVWNPVTGCTPVSPGCAHCYAQRMANRLRGRYGYPADEPFRVTVHPERLREPYHWHMPRRVFVCSMGDLFHSAVPAYIIRAVFDVMAEREQHIFQVLTKRAMRMAKFICYQYENYAGRFATIFPNVHCGVTACNQEEAIQNISELMRTPAAVRFVSFEPLLGPVDMLGMALDRYTTMNVLEGAGITDRPGGRGQSYPNTFCSPLNWVIVGAETGPGRRPCRLEWVESIVQQCCEAQVPVFVKQIDLDGRVSHDPAEWPVHLRFREYPR